MKGERFLPFPFQEKQISNGEDLPAVDKMMEESKTIDKWQLVAGTAMALASPLVPILAPAAAGMLGGSVVSHEISKDELRKRREKREAEQAQDDRGVIDFSKYKEQEFTEKAA